MNGDLHEIAIGVKLSVCSLEEDPTHGTSRFPEAERLYRSRSRKRAACRRQPDTTHCTTNLGKTGEQLSIIGFGGIVVMDEDPAHSKNIVAEAVDRGVNYFDVAPSYGNAQERLGPELPRIARTAFLRARPRDG